MMGIMEESTIPGHEGGEQSSEKMSFFKILFNISANYVLKWYATATKRVIILKYAKVCVKTTCIVSEVTYG